MCRLGSLTFALCSAPLLYETLTVQGLSLHQSEGKHSKVYRDIFLAENADRGSLGTDYVPVTEEAFQQMIASGKIGEQISGFVQQHNTIEGIGDSLFGAIDKEGPTASRSASVVVQKTDTTSEHHHSTGDISAGSWETSGAPASDIAAESATRSPTDASPSRVVDTITSEHHHSIGDLSVGSLGTTDAPASDIAAESATRSPIDTSPAMVVDTIQSSVDADFAPTASRAALADSVDSAGSTKSQPEATKASVVPQGLYAAKISTVIENGLAVRNVVISQTLPPLPIGLDSQ